MAGKRTPRALIEKRIEETQRSAKARKCPRCGKDVLVGQSEDRMFWIATVDPMPVDAVTEAIGRAEGRASYDLIRHAQGLHLHHRYSHHMSHSGAWPVLLDHVCQGRKVEPAEYPEERQPPSDHDSMSPLW